MPPAFRPSASWWCARQPGQDLRLDFGGAWRVIGHLTANYASLVDDPDGDPSLLRDHLGMYGYLDDPAMRRQVDGVRSEASEPWCGASKATAWPSPRVSG